MSSPTGGASTAGAPSTARRSWDVLLTLTRADLRDNRDLSALGLLKWLLEPLAALIAYLALIAGVLGHTERAYPLFIIIALIPFRYFSGAISSGLSVVPSYGRIIGAYPLPRGVIPLVPVVSEGASFLVGLLLVVPFAIYFGTGLSLALLWLPVVLAVFAVLTAGPVYLAAVYGLYLPDFRGVAQNLLRLTFLTSTGLVALRRVPGDNLPRLFQANPLSGIFDSFRAIVIAEEAPAAADLVYPLGIGLVLLAAGVLAYRGASATFPRKCDGGRLMDAAIAFDDAGIRYRLGRRNRRRHAFRHAGSPKRFVWGIRNITLDVAPGQYVGLIGPNGAGKTTLLLTAAGVLTPDEGRVRHVGRAAPVLGVGTGIIPGLSGWDNIELIGVLLGLSRLDVRALAPAIAEFSALGDFLDVPVRTYSAGMRARLGFAVVAHCRADVILLDEVAAVGDQDFRERSARRLAELRESGCTILAATHDLEGVAERADQVVWLDHGGVVEIGDPAAVVARYRASVKPEADFRIPRKLRRLGAPEGRHPSGGAPEPDDVGEGAGT